MDNLMMRVEALERTVHEVKQRNRRVEQQLSRWRGTAGVMLVMGLLFVPLTGRAASAQYDTLSALLAHLTVQGDDVYLDHANLHVRNGMGATDAYPTNGLGNVIIGYNEPPLNRAVARSGDHNLVVGMEHNYTSYGGVVAGRHNVINGPFASVSGGESNAAGGVCASVSGGSDNEAAGDFASVSGGKQCVAYGLESSVSGGFAVATKDETGWAAGGNPPYRSTR